jgi:hypothetical protein
VILPGGGGEGWGGGGWVGVGGGGYGVCVTFNPARSSYIVAVEVPAGKMVTEFNTDCPNVQTSARSGCSFDRSRPAGSDQNVRLTDLVLLRAIRMCVCA